MNTNSDALNRIAAINSMTPSQNYVASKYDTYCQNIRMKPVLNFDVIEIEGNLLEAVEDFVLGHCVSANFKMSQRIALEFLKQFGQLDELINQDKKLPRLLV